MVEARSTIDTAATSFLSPNIGTLGAANTAGPPIEKEEFDLQRRHYRNWYRTIAPFAIATMLLFDPSFSSYQGIANPSPASIVIEAVDRSREDDDEDFPWIFACSLPRRRLILIQNQMIPFIGHRKPFVSPFDLNDDLDLEE